MPGLDSQGIVTASDLGKHPETAPSTDIMPLGFAAMASGDAREMRRFIEGFN